MPAPLIVAAGLAALGTAANAISGWISGKKSRDQSRELAQVSQAQQLVAGLIADTPHL